MSHASRFVSSCFEVDTVKTRSALDVIKAEVSKLTGTEKHVMTVATIEPNATDSLQRFKRGRRALGSKVEDRFVATSVAAIGSAHCGQMAYLEGDTYEMAGEAHSASARWRNPHVRSSTCLGITIATVMTCFWVRVSLLNSPLMTSRADLSCHVMPSHVCHSY